VSRRGGTVRVSATRSARFVVGGRAVIAGGSRLPLWVAATHDGISFSSQVIAAGEVAQLFLVVSYVVHLSLPCAPPSACILRGGTAHRARTYLMNCLSVISMH